jgi:hypothetical protein
MGLGSAEGATGSASQREHRLLTQNYALLCLLLGILLSYAGARVTRWPHAAQVVRDVGIAFLVSIILMWTLERVNKLRIQSEVRQYVHSVGENFFKAVYGRALPQELFEVIRQSVLNQSFLRSVYNIDITIQDLSDESIAKVPKPVRELLCSFKGKAQEIGVAPDDVVLFRSTAYYEVQNISGVPAEYHVVFEITKPFAGCCEGLCGVTSARIDGHEQITDDVLYRTPDAGDDPTRLRFSRRAVVGPGADIRVCLEAYSVRRRDDKEQWQTMIPCRRMNVSAEDMDGNKDLVISLDAPLLEGNERFAVKDPNTSKASLAVAQYLLPYQGVTVTWAPCREAAPGHARLHPAAAARPAQAPPSPSRPASP